MGRLVTGALYFESMRARQRAIRPRSKVSAWRGLFPGRKTGRGRDYAARWRGERRPDPPSRPAFRNSAHMRRACVELRTGAWSQLINDRRTTWSTFGRASPQQVAGRNPRISTALMAAVG